MNTDKPDVTVTIKTITDPNTEHVFNTIVYNANELNHAHISERVDYVLSELSNYLKTYSGNEPEQAVAGFFNTFDKDLTFDRGPYKVVPIKLVPQPGGKITRRKSNRKKSKRRKSKRTRKI
jgi:hypothetical protein